MDVTRDRLVAVEGILAERLEAAEPRPAAASLPPDAAGRVDLVVVAGCE